MMDWITSIKPNQDRAILLEQNCLLSDFNHPDCTLLVVNSVKENNELPGVKERAQLCLVEADRPTLHDLLSFSDAETTILSNADVRVYSKRLLNEVVDKRAALSVLRRFDVEYVDFATDFDGADRIARKFGYLQSRFTIDLFIISRAFRTHLLSQDWTRQYCLGQSGVDMALLREAFLYGTVQRLDRDIRLLHANHEPFRVTLPINIVIDDEQNRMFSAKRRDAFKGEAVSMIFADLPILFFRVWWLRRFIVRLDMVNVRLRNRFQFFWSKMNFWRARRIKASGLDVSLIQFGRLWYFGRTPMGDAGIELDAKALRRDLRCRYLNFLWK